MAITITTCCVVQHRVIGRLIDRTIRRRQERERESIIIDSQLIDLEHEKCAHRDDARSAYIVGCCTDDEPTNSNVATVRAPGRWCRTRGSEQQRCCHQLPNEALHITEGTCRVCWVGIEVRSPFGRWGCMCQVLRSYVVGWSLMCIGGDDSYRGGPCSATAPSILDDRCDGTHLIYVRVSECE